MDWFKTWISGNGKVVISAIIVALITINKTLQVIPDQDMNIILALLASLGLYSAGGTTTKISTLVNEDKVKVEVPHSVIVGTSISPSGTKTTV